MCLSVFDVQTDVSAVGGGRPPVVIFGRQFRCGHHCRRRGRGRWYHCYGRPDREPSHALLFRFLSRRRFPTATVQPFRRRRRHDRLLDLHNVSSSTSCTDKTTPVHINFLARYRKVVLSSILH